MSEHESNPRPEYEPGVFPGGAKIGWNLGNAFDCFGKDGVAHETAWGNPLVRRELMQAIARAGFDIVRMPVTWLGHIGDRESGYAIDREWLERIGEVAGWIRDAGMKAVINIHHDGADEGHWLSVKKAAADSAVRKEMGEMFSSVWTHIARHFAHEGDWLLFEGMNEIHDGLWGWGANRTDGGLQYEIVNEWNRLFVEAVRASGGANATRWLVVAGYVTNHDLTIEHLVIPQDSAGRLVVTAHYYTPQDFCISAKVPHWGKSGTQKTWVNDKGETVSTEYGQEETVLKDLDRIATTYVQKGIPVYLGECGATSQSPAGRDFRRYWMEFVTTACRERGIVPVYWDNGYGGEGHEQFGLFDRGATLPVPYPHAEPILEAMMRGAKTGQGVGDIRLP